MSYAGFWKRLAAAIIDGIAITVPTFIIAFIFGMMMAVGGTSDSETLEGTGDLLGIVLGWIYFSAMESSPTQGTLGKMALGIKVVDLEGNRIGFGRASGRHFAKVISAIIFAIGFIMIAFTRQKQGLHDMIAGCLVIDK